MHDFPPCFCLIVQVQKKKMEYEFSMRSPVEMHKTCPVLMKKMSIHYLPLVVSHVIFLILRLLLHYLSIHL